MMAQGQGRERQPCWLRSRTGRLFPMQGRHDSERRQISNDPPQRTESRRRRRRGRRIRRTLTRGAWAAGSDKPEKEEVKIGFIPLTDCASVVMASVLGFDKKYGIKIMPSKEASWAGVRDKLVNGELDMAHVLYGLIYGVHLGVGGPKKDMAVLMSLNNNGQAITLSKKLADKGAVDGAVAGQADGRPRSANTPSRRPSRPAPTRCGCTTGWPPTASTR